MLEIIGLAMIYSWVHGVIIISKKIKDLTQYEKVLLIVGAISLTLFIIGSLSE